MPAIETVLSILRDSTCKIINDHKCFVVSLSDFHRICEAMPPTEHVSDALERKHGLVNMEIRLSPREEGRYYVVAESEPLLDQLWNKKFKP